MFLKLTNAAEGHVGTNVAIKKELVICVHDMSEEKDGVVTTKTFVFCPPHGTWEVLESYNEVVKQLNS